MTTKLVCSGCGWSQDGFWSDRYHPLQFAKKISDMMGILSLLSKGKIELARSKRDIFVDALLSTLRSRVETIESMKWWTEEEFDRDPNARCPECGHHPLTKSAM